MTSKEALVNKGYVLSVKNIDKFFVNRIDFTYNINEAKIFKSEQAVKNFMNSNDLSIRDYSLRKVKTYLRVEVENGYI